MLVYTSTPFHIASYCSKASFDALRSPLASAAVSASIVGETSERRSTSGDLGAGAAVVVAASVVVGAAAATAVGGVVAAWALDPFESELQAAQVSAMATAAATPERTRMRRDRRSNSVPSGV
jgi:hypothetical protein